MTVISSATVHSLFSPPVHQPTCISHFPLSSDLHVYKMEGFFPPSGEISCPRLSYCMQDIRMKGDVDRCTHTPLLLCLIEEKINKKDIYGSCRMFCGGCYYDLEAVCREYWTCLKDGCFFSRDLFEDFIKRPSSIPDSSSTEGSVHSNDSLSDSSPPAPGVPTQVVQPVQTTPQVRCVRTHKYHTCDYVAAGLSMG